MTRAITLTVFILILAMQQSYAQYSTKKVKSKHEHYTDSLKAVEYNYVFPFYGQQTYQKGFDIPYPMGIMGNYIWMDQGLVFTNMELGLKTDSVDIPLTPVDFIQFGENRNTSYSINVRPDLWVFPFLNVYGIFGGGASHTEVNIVYPFEFKSVVDQSFRTAGVGGMVAFGVGPVWLSVDANWTWNKPELLDKAVLVTILGIRMGHTFVFKSRPDRNFAIWIGGMRAEMASETSGQIAMKDALPPEVWDKRDEIVDDYWNWYDNDATVPEKIAADKVLTPIVNRLDAADGDAIVRYGMDKQVAEMWNGLIGVQFQLNKHWMIRSEAGVIGDRKSILASLNYRFLGFRKKG